MKAQHFKKRILLETGIFAGALIGLAALAYFISVFNDDYAESNGAMQAKIQASEAEFQTLKEKFTFITKNADLYKEVQKKEAEGWFISRQIMFEKFNQFRNQFDLSNLRLSVSPVQDMKDPKFKRATNVVRYSDVSIELDTLYDENIIALLNAMQQELSGICIISRLSMSLQRPLDPSVLQAIGMKGTYPLIKALIKFNWYSINPVEGSGTNNVIAK